MSNLACQLAGVTNTGRATCYHHSHPGLVSMIRAREQLGEDTPDLRTKEPIQVDRLGQPVVGDEPSLVTYQTMIL